MEPSKARVAEEVVEKPLVWAADGDHGDLVASNMNIGSEQAATVIAFFAIPVPSMGTDPERAVAKARSGFEVGFEGFAADFQKRVEVEFLQRRSSLVGAVKPQGVALVIRDQEEIGADGHGP